MARIDLHEVVAERLVLRLHSEYQAKRGLYAYYREENAPQNTNVPEGVIRGSMEHARFLFFATLTDRRQTSENLYKVHCRIYREHPLLYSDDLIGETDYPLERIEDILVKQGIGVPRQSARYWVECRKTLDDIFRGDPVFMYRQLGGTVEGIQEYKNNIEKQSGINPLPGYGPKISSLYALFLAELKLLPYPVDAFPVDLHVQRIFQQTNALILWENAGNVDLEEVIRPFLCSTIKKHSLDPIAVAHAFWFLGSKFCKTCYKRNDAPILCPVYTMCRGPLNTRRYFIEGQWSPHDPVMRKGGQKIFRIAPVAKDEKQPSLF